MMTYKISIFIFLSAEFSLGEKFKLNKSDQVDDPEDDLEDDEKTLQQHKPSTSKNPSTIQDLLIGIEKTVTTVLLGLFV